jgi:cell division protein FtsL
VVYVEGEYIGTLEEQNRKLFIAQKNLIRIQDKLKEDYNNLYVKYDSLLKEQ